MFLDLRAGDVVAAGSEIGSAGKTTSAWVIRGEWCGRLERSFNPSSPSAS
jgi:hypothetical protein